MGDPAFWTAIVVAIITGGLSLLGTAMTVSSGNKRIEHELQTHNAVQDEKINELTREVRIHNSFAERIPRFEQKLEDIEKRLERMEGQSE